MNHVPYVGEMKTMCVNLKSRPDKRSWVKKQLKRKNIKFKFHIVKKHRNPKRGCLESHLDCLKKAVEEKHECLFMLEDDARFVRNFNKFPKPPGDWDMLYLGGTIREKYADENNSDDWQRVSCWTTHAYIINLRNKELVKDLLAMESYPEEVDKYFVMKIHPKYKVYIMKPMMAVQKDGFSDRISK